MFGAIVAIAVAIALVSIVWTTQKVGISPTPSSPRARRKAIEALPRDFDGRVLELGSGFGGLARATAAHVPKARVIGYELSLFPYWISILVLRFAPITNLRFVREDFERAHLGESVVLCYLFPGGMSRLAER